MVRILAVHSRSTGDTALLGHAETRPCSAWALAEHRGLGWLRDLGAALLAIERLPVSKAGALSSI